MRVVLAGGAGALGRRLAADFAANGDEVTILTRARRAGLGHRQVRWDGHTVGAWSTELEDAVVVNLAGELVDKRPTARNVDLLRRSRVQPTRALVAAAARLTTPPRLWLQMSTLAIYGDAGPGLVAEGHPVADGPPQMPGVARPWEEAVEGAPAGRLVVMRTGIVLDHDMRAFDRLVGLTKLGLGGRISTGEQWVSWIHIDDFLAAVRFLRAHDDLAGIVHVTAPTPIQNRDMMAALRQAVGRPWSPPTPKPLVHVGALLMGSDPALALTSRRCIPQRLLDAGFEFAHPTFDSGLEALLGGRGGVLVQDIGGMSTTSSDQGRRGPVAGFPTRSVMKSRARGQLRPDLDFRDPSRQTRGGRLLRQRYRGCLRSSCLMKPQNG